MANAAFLDVPFVAPIPAGHDALVAFVTSSPEAAWSSAFVLDVTAQVLYCDPKLWSILHDERAIRDPLAVLRGRSWIVVSEQTCRVTGSAVSTTNAGDSNHARTRLYFDPSPPPGVYR